VIRPWREVRRLSRNVGCQSGPHYIQLCPLPRSRVRCQFDHAGQVPDDNEDSEGIEICNRPSSRLCRMVRDAAVVEVIKSWIEMPVSWGGEIEPRQRNPILPVSRQRELS
jgi:hypothetical protein